LARGGKRIVYRQHGLNRLDLWKAVSGLGGEMG
jgi:hypothetical protein